MLPGSGMSCSVCHLHLMLFYVEMYERNKMMITSSHRVLLKLTFDKQMPKWISNKRWYNCWNVKVSGQVLSHYLVKGNESVCSNHAHWSLQVTTSWVAGSYVATHHMSTACIWLWCRELIPPQYWPYFWPPQFPPQYCSLQRSRAGLYYQKLVRDVDEMK